MASGICSFVADVVPGDNNGGPEEEDKGEDLKKARAEQKVSWNPTKEGTVTNTQTYHSDSSSLPRASCHGFQEVYYNYSANYSESAKYKSQVHGTPIKQTWEGWKGLYTLNGQ